MTSSNPSDYSIEAVALALSHSRTYWNTKLSWCVIESTLLYPGTLRVYRGERITVFNLFLNGTIGKVVLGGAQHIYLVGEDSRQLYTFQFKRRTLVRILYKESTNG